MSKKILVIGSSNTDMTIKGDRLPVPGETITGGIFYMGPGGKGANQAVAAARLGGNVRMGVFATRSPFRPNPIGLSCVHLDSVELTENGPVLKVSGVDMKDGTEILDIKPYLPSYDSHPDAKEGFTKDSIDHHLEVNISDDFLALFPREKRAGILGLLADDPRPSYQDDPERIYGVAFAGYNIHFKVNLNLLTVTDVSPISRS